MHIYTALHIADCDHSALNLISAEQFHLNCSKLHSKDSFF